MDPDSAYITNRLMQKVVFGNDAPTAKDLKKSWSEWEIFAKTGTTQDNNDVWLVGGTPKYVAASWYGYDENQELTTAQKKVARNVWNTVMLALHEGDKPMNFDALAGTTVEATFCDETGLLATPECKKTETGVYKPGHLPEPCTHGAPPEEEPEKLPGKNESTTSSSTNNTTGTTLPTSSAPTSTTPAATKPTYTDAP